MQQERKPSSGDNLSNLRNAIDRPVVLIGLMGSGKTTIGKRLAQELHLPFVDADEEIEKAANLTINEIFEQFGELYFRDGERRVIARLCGEEPMIIATGGGAFVNPETRMLIKKQAISIWLDCDIKTLAERVSRKNTRPLLRNKDPYVVLAKLAKERNPLYAQADIRITSMNAPHGAAVKSIMESLTAWLK